MPGEVNFRVRGMRELAELLNKLGPEIATKVGDSALLAGAKPIVEEAKRLVPKRSGDLHDAIAARAQRKLQDDTRQVFVGILRSAPGSPSSRAHFTEFGTRHSAAKPFMRPAADAKAADAIREIGKALGRGVAREARKLAKPIR